VIAVSCQRSRKGDSAAASLWWSGLGPATTASCRPGLSFRAAGLERVVSNQVAEERVLDIAPRSASPRDNVSIHGGMRWCMQLLEACQGPLLRR